ncbi:MAG: hypothetical protein LC799_01520 [Actinobacteria bacterium]|nr:hypothetical protein [Actinomycetota bacterium]
MTSRWCATLSASSCVWRVDYSEVQEADRGAVRVVRQRPENVLRSYTCQCRRSAERSGSEPGAESPPDDGVPGSRHVGLADAASAQLDRFTRTELRSVAAVDVRELRRRADELARLYRQLDTRIQQVNWTVELSEAG